MRKKVLSLLLAAAMGAGLTACGGSAQSEPAKTEAETKTEAPRRRVQKPVCRPRRVRPRRKAKSGTI